MMTEGSPDIKSDKSVEKYRLEDAIKNLHILFQNFEKGLVKNRRAWST